MIKVHCKQCDDFLLEVPNDIISIGVKVMEAGFIYKLPILYGDKEPLYFCCPDCKEAYYDETYSVEQRQEAKRISDSLKSDMGDMVKSTQRAVGLFTEGLKKVNEKK
jgi:hypothetical protein